MNVLQSVAQEFISAFIQSLSKGPHRNVTPSLQLSTGQGATRIGKTLSEKAEIS